MKKVLQQGAKYIFGIFAFAIIALLMTLTYQALGRIFPDRFDNQIWGLVLFDTAAMCWALAFVFHSETTAQYATAAIGFLTGFIGTLGMVAAEVVLSGATLTGQDTQQIGRWMVYIFIAATIIHAALVYAHHATAPAIREKIEVGIARGEITTTAMQQATKALDEQKAELAQNITHEIISQVKRDLNLIPADGTPFQPKQQATAEPVSALNIPHPTQQDYTGIAPELYAPGTRFKDPADQARHDAFHPAGYPDNYGPLWKGSTNITPTLDAYAWVCKCEKRNAAHTRTCTWCGQLRTNGSPVTAFADTPPAATKDEPKSGAHTYYDLKPKQDEPTPAKIPFRPE